MKIARITYDGDIRLASEVSGKWKLMVQTDLTLIIAGEEPKFDASHDLIQEPHLLAPYASGTIFGIGLNYLATIHDMGFPSPSSPYLFPKLASSVVGPSSSIVVDESITTEVDWEGELAVVIGKAARNVSKEDALDYVFGYTIANDVSARDLQRKDPQWVRGKGLDTFCPLGPYIVTRDEVLDPQYIQIKTWVNDELVQDGNTSDMLFGVGDLIEYLSRYFTLQPGDVILTGTPSGCGGFMSPPRYLGIGDVVTIRVEGIGTLENSVTGPTG